LCSVLLEETKVKGSFLLNVKEATSRKSHFALPVAQLLHFLGMHC